MKDKIQIGLLVVIAAALVYLAINRSGSSSTASSAAPATTEAAKPANPVNPAVKTNDPMAQAAQAAVDNRPKTTVSFGTYEHDFGDIKQDSENKFTFTFTNTGKEPMIIESATGSCGCTVPSYPKEPIAPGATGKIDVVYKPGKQENAQQKQVTVVANTEPKQTILRIKANVHADPNAPKVATPAKVGH
jgi:hypothetical protein